MEQHLVVSKYMDTSTQAAKALLLSVSEPEEYKNELSKSEIWWFGEHLRPSISSNQIVMQVCIW